MTADKIISIARAEIGTKESPAGSNNVKYNTAFYGKAVSGSAFPWCCAFVWWVFREAGASALFYGGQPCAGCTTLMNYYKAQGQLVTDGNYLPGDLVFYQFDKDAYADHIGIIESVTAGSIIAIEGNTSLTSNDNGGSVMRRVRPKSLIMAVARPKYTEEQKRSKYSVQNGIHIVEVPVENFRLVMVDKPKKTAAARNYANAGFFTGSAPTAPVSMLICDIGDDYTPTAPVKQESTISGGKIIHQQASWDKAYYGKMQTVLGIKGGKASVFEATYLSPDYDYAIAGVPIMRNGQDVAWKTFCQPQGWAADTVRSTWHTMLGIKEKNADTVYVIGIKTTKSNTVLAAEAFGKLKALGFRDVINLDGGGSYHLNINGAVPATVSGNRQINNIILFGDVEELGNPYKEPTAVLKKGSSGTGVKWLQWQLNSLGYDCGAVDGAFGAKTLAAVKAFQRAKGLTVDGLVGPATRAALKG